MKAIRFALLATFILFLLQAVTQSEELAVSLEIHNLTGETYFERLSYLRDPFVSGMTVNAPGRPLRLAVSYGR